MVCPKCGSHNLDYLTRVIGYLKRVSSFSEMRQVEAEHRFYIHEGSRETVKASPVYVEKSKI